MTLESQLKLQAYLDGELSSGEVRHVESWLADDGEARELLAELRNTKIALSTYEMDVQLPESREFYWQKIENEIQRQARQPVPGDAPSISLWWRRFIVPAA